MSAAWGFEIWHARSTQRISTSLFSSFYPLHTVSLSIDLSFFFCNFLFLYLSFNRSFSQSSFSISKQTILFGSRWEHKLFKQFFCFSFVFSNIFIFFSFFFIFFHFFSFFSFFSFFLDEFWRF
jgi:hypothetical protein